MSEFLLLNPENATNAEIETYSVREAARAVVLDEESNLALLHVSRDGYYKLPGGGIDDGEDSEVALRRECIEEIGCKVEIVKELGFVTEYRKFLSLKQVSYCYLASCIGSIQAPQFTEHEQQRGFEPPIWVSMNEALQLLEQSMAITLEGCEYIVPRDIAIINEAQKHI